MNERRSWATNIFGGGNIKKTTLLTAKQRTVLLLAIGVFAISPNLSKAENDSFTGNSLIEGCRGINDPAARANFKMGLCLGVIKTTIDFANQRICAPENGNYGQFARVVTKYLDDHPENLNDDISLLAFKALFQAWPCKKK